MPNKVYIAGRNQTRTVTPSNIQQTIEPQAGYNALDAVVVNPIKAAMPQTIEQFIMRDQNMEPFSLNLDGAVPDYACYRQNRLVAVYGTPTSIGANAFQYCLAITSVDCRKVVSIGANAFQYCLAITSVDCRNNQSFSTYTFNNCVALEYIDCRNALSFGQSVFGFCNQLKLFDITNSGAATLFNTAVFPNNADFVILVANDTDKAHYQSATNWSTFASKIKTVAEYEQQIGMSYDDYYEIIFGHPRFDN